MIGLLYALPSRICREPRPSDLIWWRDPTFGYVDPQLHFRHALAGKWLLLLGDSSLRMTYHMLRGHMERDWQIWPSNEDSHGPSNMSAKHHCMLGVPLGEKQRRNSTQKCLEHTIHHSGSFLTFVWLDSFDADQVAPLTQFSHDLAFGTPRRHCSGNGSMAQ